MISEDSIWTEVWPVVESAIEATLSEDAPALQSHLLPDGQASDVLALFGASVFDILLKTVLGRGQLGLTRAVETDDGTRLHIEFAWPDPALPDQAITAADVVTVSLVPTDDGWLIERINPASIDMPLTELRARAVLNGVAEPLSAEAWMLPFALYAGQLQLPLLPDAMADEVEKLLLPGLQARQFGLIPLLLGRTLWRDYRGALGVEPRPAKVWAAAVAAVIGECNGHQEGKGNSAEIDAVKPTALAARANSIRRTLNIQTPDPRYSDIQQTEIIYEEDTA